MLNRRKLSGRLLGYCGYVLWKINLFTYSSAWTSHVDRLIVVETTRRFCSSSYGTCCRCNSILETHYSLPTRANWELENGRNGGTFFLQISEHRPSIVRFLWNAVRQRTLPFRAYRHYRHARWFNDGGTKLGQAFPPSDKQFARNNVLGLVAYFDPVTCCY